MNIVAYYRHELYTIARNIRRYRAWARRHPVRGFLIMLLTAWVLLVIVANTAHAAGILPDDLDYQDSSGVSMSLYMTVSSGPGVLNAIEHAAVFLMNAVWISLVWVPMNFALWLFGFLLTFEWVSWLSTPFLALANFVQSFFSQIYWIPVAVAFSAAIAGLAFMTGRTTAALWEAAVVVVIAILIGGALANPVATLTATGGFLETAQGYAGELAGSVVLDPNEQIPPGDSLVQGINRSLVDAFVRVPYQIISYGQVLPEGQCQDSFTAWKLGGNGYSNDWLTECGATDAKTIWATPSAVNVFLGLYASIATLGLLVIAGVIAFLLIISVFRFLIEAIKTMWWSHLALFPVDRQPFWRAVSGTFIGVLSMMVMVVLLAVYLRLVVWFVTATDGIPAQFRLLLILILEAIAVGMMIKARRGTLKSGERAADKIAKLGLGMGPGAQRNSGNALAKMHHTAELARTTARVFGGNKNPMSKQLLRPAPASPAPEPITLRQVPDATTSRTRGREPKPALPGGGGAAAAAITGAVKGAKGGLTGMAVGATVATAKHAATSAGKKVAQSATRTMPRQNPNRSDEVIVLQEVRPAGARLNVDSNGRGVFKPVAPAAQPPRAITATPRQPSARAEALRKQLESHRG